MKKKPKYATPALCSRCMERIVLSELQDCIRLGLEYKHPPCGRVLVRGRSNARTA